MPTEKGAFGMDDQKKVFGIGFFAGLGVGALLFTLFFFLWNLREPVTPQPTPVEPPAVSTIAPIRGNTEDQEQPVNSSHKPEASGSTAPAVLPQPEVGAFAKLRRSDWVNEISDPHLELLYQYFDRQYQAYASLHADEIADLYTVATDADYERMMNDRFAQQLICGTRSVRRQDLRLKEYEYGLTLTNIEYPDNHTVKISLLEDSTVQFECLAEADIESSLAGIEHTFLLGFADNEWKLRSHTSNEELAVALWQRYEEKRGETPLSNRKDVENIYLLLYDDLLAAARKDEADNLAAYRTAKKTPNDDALGFRYAYDRKDAAEYAHTWVVPTQLLRNEEWENYEDDGTNFVSQCLFAGGIPMDALGGAQEQWKWSGNAVNVSQNLIGRSLSWSESEAFYEYCKYNRQGGPVTEVDANLFAAKPGDVVQYRFGDRLASAVVVNTVAGSDGEPIELLLNSHSHERTDYPLSAVTVGGTRLIRVLGYQSEN